MCIPYSFDLPQHFYYIALPTPQGVTNIRDTGKCISEKVGQPNTGKCIMTNNLLISYDLFPPDKDYGNVTEAIKSLGGWARVHKSLWYVKSEHSALDAAKMVWGAMAPKDSLCVVDATNNHVAFYNLELRVHDYMKKHWREDPYGRTT